MTPALFSIGVVTLAAILKLVFAWAVFEDERLARKERRKPNPHRTDKEK